jgi:uncharacterized protein YndB with AHSA1/START domain
MGISVMLTYLVPGLVVIGLLVIAVAALIATRPGELHVSRSVSIQAPPAEIFEQVNDFHRWVDWSPYDKRDPAMKKSYDGPPSGVGASYSWNGNHEVGEGRSTITDSRPHELIRIRLEFKRPFAGVNTAEFTFIPEGTATRTTWTLLAKSNFMSKAVGLFINMDKMIGGDFEAGLANLKRVVESRAKQPA